MELIQAEDMANTETATRKSRTKRNTYVQTWRRCKRYERRQAAFVQEYVETKYHAIYDEVMKFYKSLNVSYPEKYDLRKTKEFKKMEKNHLGTPKKEKLGTGDKFKTTRDRWQVKTTRDRWQVKTTRDRWQVKTTRDRWQVKTTRDRWQVKTTRDR